MDDVKQYKKNILNGVVTSIELLALNKCYNVINWLYLNGFKLESKDDRTRIIWNEVEQINRFKNTSSYLVKQINDCVKSYNINKLKLLLSHVTNQEINWNKVLLCVAKYNDEEIIRSVLMRSPTNIDDALKICVNNRNILELFVRFGASQKVLEDKFYKNPKMENMSMINIDWDRLLVSAKSVDILHLCLDVSHENYKSDISVLINTAMVNAIKSDKYDMVEYLLDNNFILTKEIIDMSVLHGVYSEWRSVCLLIHDSAGINVTDLINNACKSGDIKETENLLNKYNYYSTGKFIKLAVDNNDSKMFSMLINEHFDNEGLIYAIENRPEFIQYITDSRIDIEYELLESANENTLKKYYEYLAQQT